MPASSRAMARKRSASLVEERDDVARLVTQEVATRQTLLSRRSSAYLPFTTGHSQDDLRFAAGAIQAVYAIHQCYDRRRFVDNSAFGVAMLGIALVFVDNEYATSSSATLIVRSINAVLTALVLVLVVYRSHLEREILVRRNVLPANASIFRTPRRLLSLITELVVCAICVPPGVDGRLTVWEWKYYLDEPGRKSECLAPFQADSGSCYMVYVHSYKVLGVLALLRLYMLPRVILNLSHFTSYRTSYLGALHHVDTQSSLFAVKCLLRTHPFKMLALGFTGTLLLTSYALAIVEAPVNPTLVPLSNAMWLVVLTMGTIGYGDLNAVTLPGQIVLIVGGMLTGILLFGVLSSALFSFLSLSDRDHRFLFLLRRHEHQQTLRSSCAHTIQLAWRHYKAKSTLGDAILHRMHSETCQALLYASLSQQRRVRLQRGDDDYRSVETELQQCQHQLLRSTQNDHRATMARLHAAEKRLNALLEQAATPLSAAA